VSRFESKTNTGFKKRALRPWKPAVLDNAAMQDVELEVQANVNNEFMQKQLESSLEIKSNQHAELQARLSEFQDKRFTVGGFFQPTNILFFNGAESQNASQILKELKEKELEILEINHQLKLTQALEQVQHIEGQLRSEEIARQSAEEKALSALRQAHQATEQIQLVKEQAYLAEQLKHKLQNTIAELEGQLRALNEKNQKQVQTLAHELDRAQELTRIETELRQFIEEDLRKTKTQLEAIQRELNEKTNNVRQLGAIEVELRDKNQAIHHLQALLEQSKNEIAVAKDRALKQSQKFTEMAEAMHRLEQSQAELQQEHNLAVAHQQQLEETLREERAAWNVQEAAHQQQMQKINFVISSERDLRNLYAEKLKAAVAKIATLEMKIQAETEARKAAENLAKVRMEQAGQAVMQIFNVANAH